MPPDFHELPQIVHVYLREKLQEDIESLLDDPAGVFGLDAPEGSKDRMTSEQIMLHMQNLDRLCEMVRLSLSEVLAKGSSPDELARLLHIVGNARRESGISVRFDDPRAAQERANSLHEAARLNKR